MSVTVRFIGTGNAFADGGRSHACIHVSGPGASLLVDCGGSALPAIKRVIDPATIDGIAISHLHGDHFGGVPYLVMEQHYAGRKTPLTVIGPPDLRRRSQAAGQALFEDFYGGPDGARLGYPLTWTVLADRPANVGGAGVSGHPVEHVPESQPHGLRVRVGDKLIAYSGDATWSDALPQLAEGADLFICEATNYATPHPVHLSVAELREHRAELRCRRLVVTHLGNETLGHLDELGDIEVAADGTVLEV